MRTFRIGVSGPFIATVVTVVSALAAVLFPVLQLRASESSEEYAQALPGTTNQDEVVAFRVLRLNAGTRKPVAGAICRAYGRNPVPGRPYKRIGVAETDEHGIANIRVGEAVARYILVSSAGDCSAAARYDKGVLSATVWPVVPRKISILDPVGRPLPDAKVELFAEHPSGGVPVSSGVTDTHGIAEFRDVDPRRIAFVLVAAKGIHSGPYLWPSHTIGSRYPVLPTRAGRTAHGRVIDADGAPVPRAVVVGSFRPWGASTVADKHGSFELVGLSPGEAIWVFGPGSRREETPGVIVRAFDGLIPLKVRIGGGIHGGGEPGVPVDIRIDPRGMKSRLPGAGEVRLTRKCDGLTVLGEFDGLDSPEAPVFGRVLVPPGNYRITVGRPFDEMRGGPSEAAVRALEPVSVTLPPRLQTRFEAEVESGALPDMAWISTVEESRDLRLEGVPGRSGVFRVSTPGVFLPATDRATFWVVSGPFVRGFEVGSSTVVRRARRLESRRQVMGEFPARTTLRFKLTTADGGSVGHVEASPFEKGDTIELDARGVARIQTWAAGGRELILRGENMIPYAQKIMLPNMPGREMDLGVIVLRKSVPRRVRLLRPDRSPAEDVVISNHISTFRTDADGYADILLDPRSPDLLLENLGPGWCDQQIAVGEDSGTEFILTGGELTVSVSDLSGNPIEGAVALLDDLRFEVEPGSALRVSGVSEGKHVLIVGAPSHFGRIYQLNLARKERRKLAIRLSPR